MLTVATEATKASSWKLGMNHAVDEGSAHFTTAETGNAVQEISALLSTS